MRTSTWNLATENQPCTIHENINLKHATRQLGTFFNPSVLTTSVPAMGQTKVLTTKRPPLGNQKPSTTAWTLKVFVFQQTAWAWAKRRPPCCANLQTWPPEPCSTMHENINLELATRQLGTTCTCLAQEQFISTRETAPACCQHPLIPGCKAATF